MKIEYKMTKTAFQELLKQRTETEKRQNPYNYVMQVINETYGLRGKVTHLIVE
ncbi:MAG: hypothetical protein NC218_11455 [Acetobacter sp.]|nr:hypothetical protein [Acetobacter sp.]